MIFGPCAREKDVARVLNLGHWPHACPPELRAHVDACRACSDYVLVTRTFRNAWAETGRAATFPAPGVLWWRAQLRRRNAALERISKPILGAQIFALSITLLIAVGFAISQARHGLRWLTWLTNLPQSPALRLENLWPFASANSGWSIMVLIPGIALLALLGGVVVLLASERK